MDTIQLALSDEAVKKCYDTLKSIRPHLKKSDFLYQIRKLQVESGYNLAFIEQEERAVAAIGFNISENLSDGKFLTITELTTLENYENREYDSGLLEWAIDYAKTKRCDKVFFDVDFENEHHKDLCSIKGFGLKKNRYALN